MHPKFEQAHLLSRQVIGAAIEVHRILGPGLLDSTVLKISDFLKTINFVHPFPRSFGPAFCRNRLCGCGLPVDCRAEDFAAELIR